LSPTAGIKLAYGPDTYYGQEVSVLEMDGQFDKLEELIYVESHLSNTSAKFYGERLGRVEWSGVQWAAGAQAGADGVKIEGQGRICSMLHVACGGQGMPLVGLVLLHDVVNCTDHLRLLLGCFDGLS
jgi:hypothetical protein